MVLPAEIVTAAETADLDAVRAWLDGKPDGGRACINEYDEYGCTLLIACSLSANHPDRRVALARLLLERGADVNRCASDSHNDHLGRISPLHCASSDFFPSRDMLDLLLAAGGNVKAKTSGGAGYIETPLGRQLRTVRSMNYVYGPGGGLSVEGRCTFARRVGAGRHLCAGGIWCLIHVGRKSSPAIPSIC